MKGKFCPKCGETGKTFYKGFCIDCYMEDHPELLKVGNLSMKQCPQCLRVFFRGEWEVGKPENLDEMIKAHVKTSIKDPEIEVSFVDGNTKREVYEVRVTGNIGGEDVSISKDVTLTYEKDVCEVCSRKTGNYYEAIIQLRPKDKEADLDRMKTALVFLRNEARALIKKDRAAEIFRYEQVKNGIDLYFGSARVAKIALQHMQATYSPLVKESYTLRGVDKETGKKRYSVTYSVRV